MSSAKQVAGAVADVAVKKAGLVLAAKIGIPVVLVLVPIIVLGGLFASAVAAVAGGGDGGYASCDVEEELDGVSITVTSEPVNEEAAETVTLESVQLTYAAEVIAVGRSLGVSARGLLIALMTGLVESKWWMYANDTVPESLDYDHDMVGSDHDSLNFFQQRPSSGWGTITQLMNRHYAATAFFGGETGPNAGSPAGLLDIEGWEGRSLGEAAQAVQGSAHPERYAAWQTAAVEILELVDEHVTCTGDGDKPTPTGAVSWPLDLPFQMTSGYGPRAAPTAGASTWHAGIDLVNPGNACGKPVYAVFDGKVTYSDHLWLSIQHDDGFTVSYLHMHAEDHLVDVGDAVVSGQQIGAVGNVQPSTACHLDIRIDAAGNTNEEVAKLPLAGDEGAPPESATFVNPIDLVEVMGGSLLPLGQQYSSGDDE